ncbi:MAG: transglycosylase SLT domain-containing protein [Bacteroides sp.]
MKKSATYFPLLIGLFLLASSPIKAQSVDILIKQNGIEREESIDLPKSMTYPLDSLLSDWKAKNYIDLGKDCSTANINPMFSDSVYIDRLSRIPAVMEMPYNEIVRKFIDMYNGRLRNQVSFMLSASNFYMPIFEEALDAYGLPMELKYLPIIESALNPSAVSRVGASGLWQFMLGTGKMYGLDTNSLVDERRDPIKATWAAARYLKELYAIYQDWNLVIAAYNCGPGTINKAVRRADGEKDYWKIYHYLPKETRGYVPAFIAANYVMTYYCKHNICPMETDIPANTDTLQVSRNLHFEQVAAVCGVSVEQLRSLNPQYKKNIIPGDSKPYTLRLPQSNVSLFIDSKDSVYNYRADEFFKNRRTVEIEDNAPRISSRKSKGSRYRSNSSSSERGDATYHKIKNGETLHTIAKRYGVRIKDLQKWNGIRNSKIAAGKRLKIYK